MADRPKFEEVSPQIIGCLRGGMSVADAARECGTKEGTVKHWLTKGRKEPESKYGNFAALADAIRQDRDEPAADERMDRDEVMRQLEKMIRKGNPQAAKLWLDHNKPEGDGDEKPADPLSEMDELAARRVARA
jgi:hypothetical protein